MMGKNYVIIRITIAVIIELTKTFFKIIKYNK